MIPRISYLIFLISAGALTAGATSQEIINRHLDAQPGGRLVIDVDFGEIEVRGSATENKTVAINAQRVVEMADKAREKEFVAAAPITITQDSNVITIRARNRDWKWNDGHTRMNARYSVQVPKSFNAELETGGGAIEVSDLSGQTRANTGGGKLKFTRLHGLTDGRTSGGAVKLTECDGTVKIHTKGGRIESVGGKGSLDAQTAGGQISVREFAGRVDIASSGGQLKLDGIDGPVKATTSGGQINATMSAANDVKLETASGAINVSIPPNGGFNIDAQSATGGVTTDLAVTADRKERDMLIGSLNGGGKPLVLRTGAGSISIKAATAERASR